MQWKIGVSISGETEYIFVKNNKYILYARIEGDKVNVTIMRTTTVMYDFRYAQCALLNEIEVLIIAPEKTKLIKNKLMRLSAITNCKNDYNKELIEFKKYFESLDKNSACGEIMEEK